MKCDEWVTIKEKRIKQPKVTEIHSCDKGFRRKFSEYLELFSSI